MVFVVVDGVGVVRRVSMSFGCIVVSCCLLLFLVVAP